MGRWLAPGLQVIEDTTDDSGILDGRYDMQGRTNATGGRMPGVTDADRSPTLLTDLNVNKVN